MSPVPVAGVLDDLARFIANPPPGDQSQTAQADQINQSANPAWVDTGALTSPGYQTPGVGGVIGLDRPLDVLPGALIGIDIGAASVAGGGGCEIAQVGAINGTSITLKSPLQYAHNGGAVIRIVDRSSVPVWWFGIACDGATVDDVGWQQAAAQCTPFNLWIDAAGSFAKRPSVLASPFIRPDSCWIRNATFIGGQWTSPADINNAMVMSQNPAPGPNTTTFTAAGGTVTTAVTHSQVAKNQIMFKYTNGTLVGAVENRVYYVVAQTSNTFQLASTLANANSAIADVNITAGQGTVFLGLGSLGKQYVENMYVNTQSYPGLNAVIDSIQQPGYVNKLRTDNAVNITGSLTAAASSFTSGPQFYVVVATDVNGNQWRTAEQAMSGSKAPDSNHQVVLNWAPFTGLVSGAVTYTIYRATASGTVQTTNSLLVSGLTATTYTDNGATVSTGTCPFVQYVNLESAALTAFASSFTGITWYWRVAAVDAGGHILASNELSAAPTSAQQVKLTWANGYANATSYNVYRSTSPNGESGATQLVVSGLAAGTTTYTDTGTALLTGSCPLPTYIHPGGTGWRLHGQQCHISNFEALACDTGLDGEDAEFMWFYGFDVEQSRLRCVHASPLAQHTLTTNGGGFLSCGFYGVHHEQSSNYVAAYDFEGNANRVIIEPVEWTAGGQTSGVGGGNGAAFILQRSGGTAQSSYIIRQVNMTVPGTAGVLFIQDIDRQQLLDAWTFFNQRGPAELIAASTASSAITSAPSILALRPNGSIVHYASAQSQDPSIGVLVGTGQTSDAFTVSNPAGNLLRILSTGELQNASSALESTGSKTATLGTNGPMVTTTPYTWLSLKSSDGSSVFIPLWK